MAMGPDQLRQRAIHYRQLAKLISDEQMQDALLNLAGEYEAKADAISAGQAEGRALLGSPSTDDGGGT